MTSADIGDSCSLSTMVLHAEARKVLARMFRELGLEEKAREWEEKSVSLSAVIERFFRIPEHALYGQYLYGRGYPVLSEKVDSLGNLLCVLLGQAHGPHAAGMVAVLPHCVYGIPCFHPQMPDGVPPYHNRAMWPFLEGYYAQAAAAVENESALALAFACMAVSYTHLTLPTGCCSVRTASSGALPGCWAVFTRGCSASAFSRIPWSSAPVFRSLLREFMNWPGWNTAA